jgi:hypothetical protein
MLLLCVAVGTTAPAGMANSNADSREGVSDNLLVEGSIPSGLTIRLAFRLRPASCRLAHGKP